MLEYQRVVRRVCGSSSMRFPDRSTRGPAGIQHSRRICETCVMDPTGIAPSSWQGASESLDIRKHRARAVELFSKGIYRQHGLQSHRGGSHNRGFVWTLFSKTQPETALGCIHSAFRTRNRLQLCTSASYATYH